MMTEPERQRLNIGAVSHATGIPVETLRTWERRYGFPNPERTPSGHRLYTNDDVTSLRLIDSALQAGHRPSNVVGRSIEELREIVNASEEDASISAVEGWIDIVKALDGAQLTKTLERAWFQFGPVLSIKDRVCPFLELVGERWAAGELLIAHEHFASATVADFLCTKWRPQSDINEHPVVLCATLSGETHIIGAQMAACAVAHAGGNVLYLGADSPAEAILTAASDRNVDAIAISVSMSANRVTTRRAITALADRLPPGCKLFIGGSGAAGLDSEFHVSTLMDIYDWTSETHESRT